MADVVGRYFEFDVSNSTVYLAAWADDGVETIQERLERTSATLEVLLEPVEHD